MIIDPHHLGTMLALFMARLTMAIVAGLIVSLFLGIILVKLLLDLHAEEPDSSESRQLDRRQDSKQRPVKLQFSSRNNAQKHREPRCRTSGGALD